ncbi:hypothetical protein PVAND_011634 [Polypedilum vanderplanki]|uniref:Uncharacterized protein n=1 Tax=Polypedilum vanderplanki TaxID=319348 RepID=A0A9J6CL03_POLVA|nr:hypothetical protein PVAND_011634 [Polypedilum vanderplanki]
MTSSKNSNHSLNNESITVYLKYSKYNKQKTIIKMAIIKFLFFAALFIAFAYAQLPELPIALPNLPVPIPGVSGGESGSESPAAGGETASYHGHN